MSRNDRPDMSAVELERALARLAAADGARPFPSAEAVRLEAALVIEQRRLSRAAAVRVGIHAAAFAICVALLVVAGVSLFRVDAPAGGIIGASCAGAVIAVAMSLWGLVRAVDEAVVLA
jgi:hypothetical protein